MGRGNRAFKNTLYMYLRTGIQIVVSLYAVRIVLKNLGIYDYGVYNTIGSIVVMSSFITSAMSSSTQRYISYALGESDLQKLSKTLNISKKLHLALGGIVFLICEIVGYVFIDKYMTIDPARKMEVLIVLQLSIITFFFNVVLVPFRAVLIAYERFDVISITTIVESVNKLLIAWFIGLWYIYSRLVTYTFLFAIITLVTFLLLFYFYRSYSAKLPGDNGYDKQLIKDMIGFSSWNFLGGFGQVLVHQLTNMFLNVFCGPIVNAAQGVANQVNGVVSRFVQDFMSAVNPQIIKSFSAKDYAYLNKVTYSSIKMSFFLIYALSIPLSFNIDYILSVWLNEVPQYVPGFIKLLLLNSCVLSLTGSISFLVEANGKIKYAQIGYTIIMALTTAGCYYLLKTGYEAYVVYYMLIASSVGCLFIRLCVAWRYGLISIHDFSRVVVANILPLSLSYFLLFYIIFYFFRLSGLTAFFISILMSLLYLPVYGYVFYLSDFERIFVKSLIKRS